MAFNLAASPLLHPSITETPSDAMPPTLVTSRPSSLCVRKHLKLFQDWHCSCHSDPACFPPRETWHFTLEKAGNKQAAIRCYGQRLVLKTLEESHTLHTEEHLAFTINLQYCRPLTCQASNCHPLFKASNVFFMTPLRIRNWIILVTLSTFRNWPFPFLHCTLC